MARISDDSDLETEASDRDFVAVCSAVPDERRDLNPVAMADGSRRSVLKSIQLSDGKDISFLHHVCEKENAPTIVFVHGFPLDHTMWLGQLPLVEHANLLMPDLPGFGASDPLAGEPTMRRYADAVANLLNRLGISKAVFCGLSMGGYIGWEFAIHYRELLNGLICCNTRAGGDDELTARAREIAARQVLQDGTEPVALAMREKLFSEFTLTKNVELVNSVVETIRRTDVTTVAAAQRAMARRSDHCENLAAIDVPALVVAGLEDVITPAPQMMEMSFLLGDGSATFVEIADAGHLAPSEQADVFNRAILHWLV